MSWILLAAGAQFVNAAVAIIDKYIVTDEKTLPRPFVYAFYSCLVTAGWVVIYIVSLIPGLQDVGMPHLRNIELPTIQVVGMSFLAAYTFFMALVSLYDALKKADASDVMPVVGSVSAIATFGLAYLLLGTSLSANFVWGIVILSLGTFLVSQVRFTKGIALTTIHSGIFFALHYIAMKGLFMETSFDDGFFWSRIAFILFALSLLLVPVYYKKITSQSKTISKKAGLLVFANKIMAGVAAFMLLKATDWGDVAVVQALDGLKFVFILIFSVLIGRFIPTAFGENEKNLGSIMRKVAYVGIICVGFIMLFT